MENEWRPENWLGQPDFCGKCPRDARERNCYLCVCSFEAGASAMLKAMDQWYANKMEDIARSGFKEMTKQ
jgi:hypothetical protein